MAHSPGPWQAEAPPPEAYLDPDIALSEEVRFWIVDEGRGSEVLAEVTVTMGGNEEANARVMAAAPEMLEALKLVFDLWLKEEIRDARNILAEGRAMKSAVIAAIAKAEGK